jgi:hypothetical protein
MENSIMYVLDKAGNMLTWIPSSSKEGFEKDFVLKDTKSEAFDWLLPLEENEDYVPVFYFFDKGFCLATIYLDILDYTTCKVLNFNDIIVECNTLKEAKELCLKQKISLDTLRKKGLIL